MLQRRLQHSKPTSTTPKPRLSPPTISSLERSVQIYSHLELYLTMHPLYYYSLEYLNSCFMTARRLLQGFLMISSQFRISRKTSAPEVSCRSYRRLRPMLRLERGECEQKIPRKYSLSGFTVLSSILYPCSTTPPHCWM